MKLLNTLFICIGFSLFLFSCKSIQTKNSAVIEITGIVHKQGITSYQYGTHTLGDYALKSSTVSLNDFVNKNVTITGYKVAGYPIEGGPDYIEVESVKVNKIFSMKPSKSTNSVNGKWQLIQINQVIPDEGTAIPILEINTIKSLISGSAGCNRISAAIERFKPESVLIKRVGTTRMACNKKNIEYEYINTLNKVRSYKVDDDKLYFFDKEGNEILVFVSTKN